MSNIVKAILGGLAIVAIITLYYFITDLIRNRDKIENYSYVKLSLIGLVTNFLDVLGIGSYATVTVGLKLFNLSEDRVIPGTLNVGLAIPVILEAFIFIKDVQVETLTLVSMILAATLGSWIGADIVSKLPEKKVQTGMGVCLLATAVLMLAGKFNILPSGGEEIGLSGIKLIIAVGVNFILGALMTLGIGLYAPCMALVYALGMSPLVAFPIMFGSSAFLMPVAAIKFIKNGAYNRQAALALTISGIVGVLLATTLVTSMDIEKLLWIVIFVVIYTGITMLRSAKKSSEAEIA